MQPDYYFSGTLVTEPQFVDLIAPGAHLSESQFRFIGDRAVRNAATPEMADLTDRMVQRDRLTAIHAGNDPQRELLRTIHSRHQRGARGVARYAGEAVFHNFLHGIAAQELAACPKATGVVRADIEAEARRHAHLRDAAQAVQARLQRDEARRAQLAAAVLESVRTAGVLHDDLQQREQVTEREQHRALKRRRPPNCTSPLRRAALVGCAAAGAPPTVKATDNRAQLAQNIHKVTDPM